MQIRLSLVLSVIVEAVKAETYFKGKADRATDEKASQLAYHETAGDDFTDERKIMRDIYTSCDTLRAFLSEYASGERSHTGDNITLLVDEPGDHILMTLDVSRRFNLTNTDALARKCSEFITYRATMLWWVPINGQHAQYYLQLLEQVKIDIPRFFIKTPPRPPRAAYTGEIKLSVNALTLAEGETGRVGMEIDDWCADDIELRTDNPDIALGERRDKGFTVVARHKGTCDIVAYSRHNTDICRVLRVTVKG